MWPNLFSKYTVANSTRLSEKELVATSGAYSYGLVTVTKELPSMSASFVGPTFPS